MSYLVSFIKKALSFLWAYVNSFISGMCSLCELFSSRLFASQSQMRVAMSALLLAGVTVAFAQNGAAQSLETGISEFSNAVETMKQFVPIVKNLCYILAVVFGFIGGVLIVIALNNHEQDVNKKIAMTVGAVVFMLVIAQAIPLIFGIPVD